MATKNQNGIQDTMDQLDGSIDEEGMLPPEEEWDDEVDDELTEELANEEINFEDVDENAAFPILRPGTYPGVVDKAEFKVSKNRNPMIEIQYVFTDPNSEKEARVWDYIVLKPDQLPRAKKRLKTIFPGLPGRFVPADHTDLLVGCHVTGVLTTENTKEYGRRNKLKRLLEGVAVEQF